MIWSPKSPPMLHTKDIRNPTYNLVDDGVYTLASAPSLAEAIQEFTLQGFDPISIETHCQNIDWGLGNPQPLCQISNLFGKVFPSKTRDLLWLVHSPQDEMCSTSRRNECPDEYPQTLL